MKSNRKDEQTLKLLQSFCCTEQESPFRHELFEPWLFQGQCYATNAHIMIRVPKIAGVRAIKAAPQQGALRLFESANFSDLVPAPNVDLPVVRKRAAKAALLSGKWIDVYYLRKMWRLPGLHVVNRPMRDGQPLPFKFDGGEGLVMHMHEPTCERLPKLLRACAQPAVKSRRKAA